MKQFDYIVWKEDKYFVSLCLNVNVSSFGETIESAISNLKEAVELYFEDEAIEMPVIGSITLGKEFIYA